MTRFKRTMFIGCAALLACSSVLGLAACGDDEEGGSGKMTTLQFWGSGDEDESKVFGEIVAEFNKTIGQEKRIRVEYSSNHGDVAANAMQLSGKNPPDVIYVPDRNFKSWVQYLQPLTDPNTGAPLFEGVEEFTKPGAVWEQGIRRYRFDIATQTVTDDAALWALPKDIGPTALYYNREYLKELGIEHLSLTAEEAKAQGYPEKGYFKQGEKWYFNNKVPMSWDEVTALATRMQNEIDACKYGYFTEWWFSYGWSVGGDCVEYIPETPDADGNPMGYYELTLNDTSPNYIVKDECIAGINITSTVAGKDVTTHYSAGEIVSYTDKKNAKDTNWQADCNELPSMADALLEFVALTSPTSEKLGTTSKGVDVYGKKVSMGQNSIGQQSARDRFVAGSFGMFVGGRWEVTHLRKKIGTQGSWMKDNESWDVAPLPMYKEYYEEGDTIPAGKKVGDIKVHGVQAGHSGSMGLAIAMGSKKKEAAWELVKYVAGVPGQTAQAQAGFCIPNQIDVAKTDVFLQPEQAPKNAQVFVDAAQYETPGDWWYLKDGLWIDDWALCLNTEVRENTKKIEQLFAEYSKPTQDKLYLYTYNSHNTSAKPKN